MLYLLNWPFDAIAGDEVTCLTIQFELNWVQSTSIFTCRYYFQKGKHTIIFFLVNMNLDFKRIERNVNKKKNTSQTTFLFELLKKF